jgi:hypothetical protein
VDVVVGTRAELEDSEGTRSAEAIIVARHAEYARRAGQPSIYRADVDFTLEHFPDEHRHELLLLAVVMARRANPRIQISNDELRWILGLKSVSSVRAQLRKLETFWLRRVRCSHGNEPMTYVIAAMHPEVEAETCCRCRRSGVGA